MPSPTNKKVHDHLTRVAAQDVPKLNLALLKHSDGNDSDRSERVETLPPAVPRYCINDVLIIGAITQSQAYDEAGGAGEYDEPWRAPEQKSLRHKITDLCKYIYSIFKQVVNSFKNCFFSKKHHTVYDSYASADNMQPAYHNPYAGYSNATRKLDSFTTYKGHVENCIARRRQVL